MKGYTLLEVLLSFFIISIVLILLVNLYPMSYLTLRRGEHLLVADGIARELVSQARASDYETLLIGHPRIVPKAVRDGIEYQPVVEVNTLDGFDDSLGKAVVVRVSWEEKGLGMLHVTHRLTLVNVPE